jgi:hypothetical protein
MAGVTLAQAQAQLNAWLAASLAVAGNQSYTIGMRTLTRANAKEIQGLVSYWERRVQALSRGPGGMRVRYAVI